MEGPVWFKKSLKELLIMKSMKKKAKLISHQFT